MERYHISKFDDGKIYVTKDINRKGLPGKDYAVNDIKNAWKSMYIIEVGDKVVDPFGVVVTIKEIIHHDTTQTTNYLVEENGNTYNPWELCGIFVNTISEASFKDLTKYSECNIFEGAKFGDKFRIKGKYTKSNDTYFVFLEYLPYYDLYNLINENGTVFGFRKDGHSVECLDLHIVERC